MAEKIWSRAFQFVDATSKPTWQELLGPDVGAFLDQLPVERRIRLIWGRYNFKAHGLSLSIERQQNLSKYKDLLMTFAQLGPQALVQAGLQLPVLLKRIFDAYHFPDPAELLAPNAAEMQEQSRQAQIAQQNPFLQAQAQAHGQIAASREANDQQTQQKLIDAALQMHQQPPQGPVQ